MHILNCGLEPTAVAEANTQQAFVDILDNDVIKPLKNVEGKLGTSRSGGQPCSDNGIIRKETEDRTRKRIEEDLNKSAANYADYAENTIAKLQQAYFKKYHPR